MRPSPFRALQSGGAPYVVGVGSSGPLAACHVRDGVARMAAHPQLVVRAVSRFYGNPAVGQGTTASFLNGAVVVETPLSPPALLLALRAIESEGGRIRGRQNGARTLDLDVLLAPSARASTDHPRVPHPRLFERAFALVPAVEALERAGLRVPDDVARAAAQLPGRATLREAKLPPMLDPGLVRGDASW